jgi:ankyrin repeat protein
VVKYLLDQGADPNILNADGETPIYYAEDSAGTEEVIEVLREHGGSS